LTKPKRIAIVGPECTGKTSLAKSLASHYHTRWVPEYAREYIDGLERQYTYDDLRIIADHQVQLEDKYANNTDRILICDTTLVVIKIWSEFKFGKCDDSVLREMNRRKYDLTLLTYVDVPWENDPQREHPEKRNQLFDIYLKELMQQRVDFVQIDGDMDIRLKLAIDSIDNLF
jgi:NadR type nicotinamide-nucleotide adenylyltransferase